MLFLSLLSKDPLFLPLCENVVENLESLFLQININKSRGEMDYLVRLPYICDRQVEIEKLPSELKVDCLHILKLRFHLIIYNMLLGNVLKVKSDHNLQYDYQLLLNVHQDYRQSYYIVRFFSCSALKI